MMEMQCFFYLRFCQRWLLSTVASVNSSLSSLHRDGHARIQIKKKEDKLNRIKRFAQKIFLKLENLILEYALKDCGASVSVFIKIARKQDSDSIEAVRIFKARPRYTGNRTDIL